MYHISCAVAVLQRAGALFLFIIWSLPLKYHESITAPYDRHVLLSDPGTVDPKGRFLLYSAVLVLILSLSFFVNSKAKSFRGKSLLGTQILFGL